MSTGPETRTQPLTVVVLAAGLGSRYGGLKQLDPLGPGGATLMDYSLYDAWRAGFRRAVFVIRPGMAEALSKRLDRHAGRFEIALAPQRLDDLPPGVPLLPGRERPWGTTQAVLAACDQITGPFAVLNADDCYGAEALQAAGRFLQQPPPSPDRHAVVGYRLDRTLSPSGGVNRAVLECGGGSELRRVIEVRGITRGDAGEYLATDGAGSCPLRGDTRVSMNLWALRPGIFPHLLASFARFLGTGPGLDAECCLPDSVQECIAIGRAQIEVLDTTSRWCGVTYPADRAWVVEQLSTAVRRGQYPERPWA